MIVGLFLALAVTPAGWTVLGIGALVLISGPILAALWSSRGMAAHQGRSAGYTSLLSFVLALIEKPDRECTRRGS